MKRTLLGIVAAVSMVATLAPVAAASREAQAVVLAAKRAERDWLAHRAKASCSHYTGAAKRKLVAELGVSLTCEGSLRVVFDLMGPDDDARTRRTLRALDQTDVSIARDRAYVALGGNHVLRLRRVEGRWYISDPSTAPAASPH